MENTVLKEVYYAVIQDKGRKNDCLYDEKIW